MTNAQNFLRELSLNAWATSASRFNAARRLKRRDFFATLSIALFSAIGIALAVLQKTYSFKADSPGDRYLTLLGICIGLFTGVISLIEWGAGNSLRADALHRNADELNGLHRKVSQSIAFAQDGQQLTAEKIDTLRTEYEAIKGKCVHNHEPIDHQYFLAQQRLAVEFLTTASKPKIGWLHSLGIEFKFWIYCFSFYPLLWLTILGLICMIPKG
jgi:hypothetical protein